MTEVTYYGDHSSHPGLPLSVMAVAIDSGSWGVTSVFFCLLCFLTREKLCRYYIFGKRRESQTTPRMTREKLMFLRKTSVNVFIFDVCLIRIYLL